MARTLKVDIATLTNTSEYLSFWFLVCPYRPMNGMMTIDLDVVWVYAWCDNTRPLNAFGPH